jgi:hypothetical protein
MAAKMILVSDLTGNEIKDDEKLIFEHIVFNSILFNEPVKKSKIKIWFKGVLLAEREINPNGNWNLDLNVTDFVSVYDQKMKDYDHSFDDV